MGTVVSLDYSAMKDTSRAAKKAADYCQDYADEIKKKITRRLGDLKLGGNGNTSQADYFARKKIQNLENKKREYEKYSKKVDEAREYAKSKDSAVSGYIKKESNEFRKRNDMKVSKLEELFAWVTTTLLNSTEFGRWLNQKMKDISNWVDDKMRKFKQWYHLEGGKYIIKTVLAVVGTIIAVVFLVCVAWPALMGGFAALMAGQIWIAVTAVASFITAILSVADGITKVFANIAAYAAFEDDPGWARRYGSYTSLPEYLRKNNFHNGFLNKISYISANAIDVVSTLASVIGIADLARNGFKFYQSVKEKGVHTIFRKMNFRTKSGKISWSSFKYGMKSVFENIKAVKNGIANTNISRLQGYYEKNMGGYKIYKTIKSFNSNFSKFSDWADKGTAKFTKDTIKEKIKSTIKGKSLTYDYGEKIKNVIDEIKKTTKKVKSTPSYVYE